MYRLLLPLLVLLVACTPDATDEPTVSFDREAMLEHWADNIIVPAFQDFRQSARRLDGSIETYLDAPSATTLEQVREQFARTYLRWQRLSPFMVGPGMELRLREQVNTYPTDTERLLGGDRTDLSLPSNTDVQGLPALDFLLFGTDNPLDHAGKLRQLSARLVELAAAGEDTWTGGYRDTYVTNSGNSATASIDRTVNNYVQWYERNLRAGKVGIPAGVFANRPLPELVEAPYHGELSKRLFLEALDGANDFFSADPGLASYLDALDVKRDGEALSARIQSQFAAARAQAAPLADDFASQVRTDNTAMLQLYDALQRNVILLKVDMLQALSINVDYVDADGD